MDLLGIYLALTYGINLLLCIIMTVNDYKAGRLFMNIGNILFASVFLLLSPVSVWIMLVFIVGINLPEDFWSRPIIKLKKK